MKDLIVVGLIHDVAGAMILVRAIAFARDKIINAQAGTYWGGNNALLRALCEQRYDARWGLALIVTGFLWQIVAQILSSTAYLLEISLISLVASPIAYLAFREKSVARKTAQLINRRNLESRE